MKLLTDLERFLAQQIISPIIPNESKCHRHPPWYSTSISGYQIANDNSHKIYYTDAFNRLMVKDNNSTFEITKSKFPALNWFSKICN